MWPFGMCGCKLVCPCIAVLTRTKCACKDTNTSNAFQKNYTGLCALKGQDLDLSFGLGLCYGGGKG